MTANNVTELSTHPRYQSADPRMTSRYDRARQNLDRHGNYVLAAYLGGAA